MYLYMVSLLFFLILCMHLTEDTVLIEKKCKNHFRFRATMVIIFKKSDFFPEYLPLYFFEFKKRNIFMRTLGFIGRDDLYISTAGGCCRSPNRPVDSRTTHAHIVVIYVAFCFSYTTFNFVVLYTTVW